MKLFTKYPLRFGILDNNFHFQLANEDNLKLQLITSKVDDKFLNVPAKIKMKADLADKKTQKTINNTSR